MSITLFDLSYRVSEALGQTYQGTATGGAITPTCTIIDIVERGGTVEINDYWKDGTAWVLYTSDAAAPQGERSYISGFTQTGGIVTLRSIFTAAVAAGDIYALAKKRYPMQILDQEINNALRQIGPLEINDTTTITFATNQTIYNLPSNVLELREVWEQTNDVTNDDRWERMYDWDVQKSATGTANKLVLRRQPETAYDAKLVYFGYHSPLYLYSSKLDDSFNPNLVVYRAAVGCLMYRKLKLGEDDKPMNDAIERLTRLANEADIRTPVNLPHKTPKTIHFKLDRP